MLLRSINEHRSRRPRVDARGRVWIAFALESKRTDTGQGIRRVSPGRRSRSRSRRSAEELDRDCKNWQQESCERDRYAHRKGSLRIDGQPARRPARAKSRARDADACYSGQQSGGEHQSEIAPMLRWNEENDGGQHLHVATAHEPKREENCQGQEDGDARHKPQAKLVGSEERNARREENESGKHEPVRNSEPREIAECDGDEQGCEKEHGNHVAYHADDLARCGGGFSAARSL